MAQTPNYSSASLYVGDLAFDVTEAQLFEIFNQVGPVASIRVCRDAVTRRSLGYAYINFHSVVDAERALDTLNFTNIKNRPCRIMWSQRDPSLRKSGVGNIFIKNLDKTIDNKTLFDTFSVFGNILSAKIAQAADGTSLGYGFIHFDDDESALKAIDKVNGMLLNGKAVSVAHFKPRSERGGPDRNRFTNVYIKNLPLEITSEQLQEMFAKFGKISNCMISVDETGKSKGFGFINFDSHEEAQAAVAALHDTVVNGSDKKLYVGRAQKKTEREKELRARFEQFKAERQKKYVAGTNLYVKNLADDVDDEMLRTEFAKFGPITSAKVMRDADTKAGDKIVAGRSRGFGFVCFTAPEDATKAVTEMNGKMFHTKPLYVALAQRKEVRRAQLEAQFAMARAKVPQGMPPMYPGPMFYPAAPQPGMPRPGGFIYPQQMMMPPRGPVGRGPFPVMPAGGRGMPPAGFMPMGAAPAQQVPRNRPPRAGPPSGAAPNKAVAPSGGAPVPSGGRGRGAAPGVRYNANARNAGQAMPAQASGEVATAVVPALGGMEPLSLEALARATVEVQKQMIGERLFPLVAQRQPDLAGKITGMLLEMDNSELLALLDSQAALSEKVAEAMIVLQEHEKNETA